MLAAVTAYHRAEAARARRVLETDGNLYSDHHRAEAQKQAALHEGFLADLMQLEQRAAHEDVAALRYLIDLERVKGEKLVELSDADTSMQPWLADDRAISARVQKALQASLGLLLENLSRPRRTHRKRGGTYSLYGLGAVQSERPLLDGDAIVLYRSDADGSWWARPPLEMYDGRFACTPEAVESHDPYAVTVFFAGPDLEIEVMLDARQREMVRLLGRLELTAPYPADIDGGSWAATSWTMSSGKLCLIVAENR